MTKLVALLGREVSRMGATLYINGLVAALIAAVAAIAGATYFAMALVAYLDAVGVL